MTINRRDFIKSSVVAGIGMGLGSKAKDAEAGLFWFGKDKEITDPANSDFFFVHMADQHVFDRRHGVEGYRTCIQSINDLKRKPNFVVMGGDMVFDGCYNTKEDYLRWLKQTKETSDELEMPWYPCMGNHDPFGMHPRRKTTPDDPDIGKKLIQDMFDWPQTYYSFDHQGWHFAILDCMLPVETDDGLSAIPKIGEEQLEWLAYDLGAAGDRPKIVVSHVAVLYLKPQADGNTEVKAKVPGMVLEDNRELRLVLERHGVQAFLQGHCHHVEEFMYNNVRYITSASGSGAWWSGDWSGNKPGYTLFRCNGDLLSWEHLSYDWEAKLDEKDTLERERQAEYDAAQAKQIQLRNMERAGREIK